MDITTLFPSSYLKAADLQGQPRQVVIESCVAEKISDSETKPVLRFVGIDRGLILNRTNAAVIVGAFGSETNGWVGKGLTLMVMPVNFQGRMVDAIRVQVAASEQATPQFQAPPVEPPATPTTHATDKPNDDIPW